MKTGCGRLVKLAASFELYVRLNLTTVVYNNILSKRNLGGGLVLGLSESSHNPFYTPLSSVT